MSIFKNCLLAKPLSFFLLTAILNGFFPSKLLAIKSRFFQSIGNNPLEGVAVDNLTGDFSYNMHLLRIPGVSGGFSLNLFYNAGISLDQESSWIGLGWNCFPGGINRTKKGFPDDWDSKKVTDFLYKWPSVYRYCPPGGLLYTITSIVKRKQTAFGSLYNARAYQVDEFKKQDPDFIMDMHENPYSQDFSDELASAQLPTLALPSYDDYELVSPDFVYKMSPKIFEFGTLTGTGRVFNNWDETFSFKRCLPKLELAYVNRDRFTDRKVHFYIDGEHSSYGQIRPYWSNPLTYNLKSDVVSGPNFFVQKIEPYENQTLQNSENRLKTGNFVKWYSNFELYPVGNDLKDNNTMPVNTGFIECSEMSKDRSSLSATDPQGIGAFSVTTPEGKTYHYSLPVYQHEEFTCYQKITDPENDLNIKTSYNKYAYTWLLTAITGSDFIDKGNIGELDPLDEGYWVKFEYGKWTEGYPWRFPFYGSIEAPANYWYGDRSGYSSYSFGIKELYYLNSIQTKSHTAYFIKSLGKDGLSHNNISFHTIVIGADNESINLPEAERHQTLKLDKIVLLNNADTALINKSNLNAQFLPSKTGYVKKNNEPFRNFNIYLEKNILDVKDIEGNLKEIESKAVEIIEFNQDYSLCQNSVSSSQGGKLTLKSVDFFNCGKNKIQPSSKFFYLKNRDYNKSYKDRWGFYSSKQFDHSKPDADTWSLNEIQLPSGGKISVKYESDVYEKIENLNGDGLWGKTGGGIRVSEIKVDEGTSHTTTKYNYNNPITNVSSGVISYRPNVDGFVPYVYELAPPQVRYEYSSTENYGSDGALLKKTQYKFDAKGRYKVENIQHSLNHGVHQDKNANDEVIHSYIIRLRASVFIDNSAALGRPLSITTYNRLNQIVDQTTFDYYPLSEIKAGIRQESFGQLKRFFKPWGIDHFTSDNYFITALSSKISYPSVLKKRTTITHGVTNINEYGDLSYTNNGFDLLTGKPLITKSYIANKEYKTVSVPCYTKLPYSKMGSKADDITNKNMLVHETANYTYVKDDIDFTPTEYLTNNIESKDQVEEYTRHNNQRFALKNIDSTHLGLIKASVQTWKPKWTYRGLNSARNTYVDNADSTSDSWRPHQNYVWNSIPNADGTIKINSGFKQVFKDFEWSIENIKDNWQLISEIKKTDINSNPLESADVNGLSFSIKTDTKGFFPLAKCNASYAEFTFSGAEEIIPNTDFFDGEVSGASHRFDATLMPQYAHTGNFSIKLNTQSEGFKYSAQIGTENNKMQKGKKYKASVWVRSHVPSSVAPLEASLVYSFFNNNTLVFRSQVNATDGKFQQAGNWFLMTLEIDIPSSILADRIEISVSANAGASNAMYFDDFRVHPLSVPMESYVYDVKSGLKSAVLDENNFGVKYFYDAAGKLLEEHQEFIDRDDKGGFVKVKENSYNYSRGIND